MKGVLGMLGLLIAGALALAQDTIPPTSFATLDPAPNPYGWNNTPVTITITATDNGGSGVQLICYSVNNGPVTCVPQNPHAFTLTQDGKHTVRYWAVDNAGNAESPKTVLVWIDTTPPRIRIHAPVDGAKYLVREKVKVDWWAYDALSGILEAWATAASGDLLDTAQGGYHDFFVEATDRAGNKAPMEVEYQVLYRITATGQGGNFLDRVLPPEEVVKVGLLYVMARYKVGEAIKISFVLQDVDFQPFTTALPTLTVTEVLFEPDGTERHRIWFFGGIRYSAEEGQYVIRYDTKERAPGLYDLWIGFGDGQSTRIRVELLPAE